MASPFRTLALVVVLGCSRGERTSDNPPTPNTRPQLWDYLLPAVCAHETTTLVQALRFVVPMRDQHLQYPGVTCTRGKGEWDCRGSGLIAAPRTPNAPPNWWFRSIRSVRG